MAAAEQRASLSCGGPVQPENEVIDQLGKMASALTIHKRKMVQFTGLLYPCQPVFDDNVRTAMEYLAHSLLARPVSRFLNEQSFSNEFCEPFDFEWFH